MTVDWPLLGDMPALDGLDPATVQAVKDAAVNYLRRWSNGAYGLEPATVYPTRMRVRGLCKWLPVAVGGSWHVLSCDRCASQFCSCERVKSLRFPFRVDSITQISIDGAVVEASAYELRAHRVLLRVDGGVWPRPEPTSREFQIDLIRGVPVPAGGRIAAAELANEIGRAVAGDPGCRLPARVQTITRQGVTVGMLDSMSDLEDGKTGLWLVDSWLSSVMDAPRIGGLWSPDSDPGRVMYR